MKLPLLMIIALGTSSFVLAIDSAKEITEQVEAAINDPEGDFEVDA